MNLYQIGFINIKLRVKIFYIHVCKFKATSENFLKRD